MIEQIKSDFKLWTQAIARTIENSVKGMKVKHSISYGQTSLVFMHGDDVFAIPDKVFKELYDDGASIMDIVCVILDLSEEKLGIKEDKDEIEDANLFYAILRHKINLDDSMDWAHEYFVPQKDVYVALVEDKDGVVYECVWRKQDDQFTINKY